MKQYIVRVTPAAQNDIYQVVDHISNIYKAPLTAEKFLTGLYDALLSLENSAESIHVSSKTDILKFGRNTRSIVFKKLVIIYSVRANVVIVEAVIPGSLIKS